MCVYIKAQRRQQQHTKNCRIGKKLSYVFYIYISLRTLFQYFVFIYNLYVCVCVVRGHLLVRCKWDKQKEASRKKCEHKHAVYTVNRAQKGSLIGFVRLLNENVSFISWRPLPLSYFYSIFFPFHYYYYLCLFLFSLEWARRTEK